MDAFDLPELMQQREQAGRPYLEFLRVPDLSVGLYQLPANGTDPQLPHTEDEVYYVLNGKARVRVGSEDREVRAGSLVYVMKNVEHHFHSIAESLMVLVFFAPAEGAASS
jgi:quercetin dioxygenase-like cupin family protein